MKLFNTPVNGIYLPIIMSSIWPTASSNFVSMAFELWKKNIHITMVKAFILDRIHFIASFQTMIWLFYML